MRRFLSHFSHHSYLVMSDKACLIISFFDSKAVTLSVSDLPLNVMSDDLKSVV